MRRSSRANPMSKATGYRRKVYNAVYDFRGIVLAYGPAFALWMLYDMPTSITSIDDALMQFRIDQQDKQLFGDN